MSLSMSRQCDGIPYPIRSPKRYPNLGRAGRAVAAPNTGSPEARGFGFNAGAGLGTPPRPWRITLTLYPAVTYFGEFNASLASVEEVIDTSAFVRTCLGQEIIHVAVEVCSGFVHDEEAGLALVLRYDGAFQHGLQHQ